MTHPMFRGRVFAALLGLAVTLAGCGAFENSHGRGGDTGNLSITRSIREQFEQEPMVHLGDVGVVTLEGTVRLTGRVNSERARRRAAEIARETAGVRHVENEIAVRALVAPAPEDP